MRKLTSEFIGSFLLALSIVGAGAMATSITQDSALRLLINGLTAAAVLALIINAFGAISGGHFNPAVTLVFLVKKEISGVEAIKYILVQVAGGIAGVITANYLFGLDLVATKSSSTPGSVALVSEVLSTAGLLFVITHLINQEKSHFIPVAVPLWIFSGYFFTPTSVVANPAMTIGRAFTDSYSGIPSEAVALFVVVQIAGGLLGYGISSSLKK